MGIPYEYYYDIYLINGFVQVCSVYSSKFMFVYFSVN